VANDGELNSRRSGAVEGPVSQALAYVGTAGPLLRGNISGFEDRGTPSGIPRVGRSVFFRAGGSVRSSGRTLSAEDELPGAPAAVVLSYGPRGVATSTVIPAWFGRTIVLETILRSADADADRRRGA